MTAPPPPMRPPRIALATAANFPDLSPDDQLLLAALRETNVDARAAVWSAPSMAWTEFDAVVIRSCWDYHLRLTDFRAWITSLADTGVALFNPPGIVIWNSDKRYLRDLAGRGVRTLPTVWLTEDSRGVVETLETLDGQLEARGWDRVVIKPAVSASAYETWRTAVPLSAGDRARIGRLLVGGTVLVQPFVEELSTEGEHSFVFLGGAFSHAVLKRPAPGDFRVQCEHGGSAESISPGADLVDQARDVVSAVGSPLLYARVDGVVLDGEFVLMELELIEPSLFLGADSDAADRLAEAIAAAASRAPLRIGGDLPAPAS